MGGPPWPPLPRTQYFDSPLRFNEGRPRRAARTWYIVGRDPRRGPNLSLSGRLVKHIPDSAGVLCFSYDDQQKSREEVAQVLLEPLFDAIYRTPLVFASSYAWMTSKRGDQVAAFLKNRVNCSQDVNSRFFRAYGFEYESTYRYIVSPLAVIRLNADSAQRLELFIVCAKSISRFLQIKCGATYAGN